MLQPYPERVRYAQGAFADGDYEEAIRALEALKQAGRDRVVFRMELGTFLQASGDYKRSTEAFLEAVAMLKEFDKRAVVSLRDAAAFGGALVVNDTLRPYRGAAHERVLLHTFLAMNFLLQKNLEEARVEILQAYARQKEAREEHDLHLQRTESEAKRRTLDSGKIAQATHASYKDQREILKRAGNVYQNAFTYYLSSMVYEMNGEIDDAYIDAKTVYALNPAFLPVRRDLVRFSRKLGLQADSDRWRRAFGGRVGAETPAGHGEIVLLHLCGRAPVKRQIKITVPVPTGRGVNWVAVAIPKYARRSNPAGKTVLLAGGREVAATTPLMDVEATAIRGLWDEAPGIAARQVLRAGWRFALSEYSRKEGKDIFADLISLLGHVVEQADLRSWNSLPRDFQVARADVPAGAHDLELVLAGRGVSGRIALRGVPVRKGGITIVVLRSIGNRGTARYVSF